MLLWEIYNEQNIKLQKIINLAVLTENNQLIFKKIHLKNLTKNNDKSILECKLELEDFTIINNLH